MESNRDGIQMHFYREVESDISLYFCLHWVTLITVNTCFCWNYIRRERVFPIDEAELAITLLHIGFRGS